MKEQRQARAATSGASFEPSGMSDHARFMEELRQDQVGFERLAAHLKRLAGIHLPTNEKNLSLMASRLGFILREHQLPNYAAFALLLAQADPDATQIFVESLTTNTTQFFRESAHFDLLTQVLPGLLKSKLQQGGSELRLWCAAASTGQEPYTILMTLLETLPSLSSSNIKFLASDIDHDVLSRAARGVYTDAETKVVPPVWRQKYFTTLTPEPGTTIYRVNPVQRRMITFAPFNLMTKSYPFQHRFDVIFCRNVLIYFEREVAIEVTKRLMNALAPGGYLFLGHSESGLIKGDGFKSVASAAYMKDY